MIIFLRPDSTMYISHHHKENPGMSKMGDHLLTKTGPSKKIQDTSASQTSSHVL